MAGTDITERNLICSFSTGRVLLPNDPSIDGLEDFYERSNRNKNINDFLKSDEARSLLQYDQLSRILSIGTGFGNIENNFISLCKNAKQFIGIEPVSARCDVTLKCITTTHPHIKITFYNGVFEDYEAPDEKVDIVLLNHVLYHFKDLSSTIKRAVAMVRSGGKVLITTDCGDINATLGDHYPDGIDFDKRIRKAIEDNYVLYTEVALPNTEVDLTHEGDGYYDFLYIFLNRSIFIEERKECIGKLMQTAVPGTNIVHQRHKAFIIQK